MKDFYSYFMPISDIIIKPFLTIMTKTIVITYKEFLYIQLFRKNFIHKVTG